MHSGEIQKNDLWSKYPRDCGLYLKLIAALLVYGLKAVEYCTVKWLFLSSDNVSAAHIIKDTRI